MTLGARKEEEMEERLLLPFCFCSRVNIEISEYLHRESDDVRGTAARPFSPVKRRKLLRGWCFKHACKHRTVTFKHTNSAEAKYKREQIQTVKQKQKQTKRGKKKKKRIMSVMMNWPCCSALFSLAVRVCLIGGKKRTGTKKKSQKDVSGIYRRPSSPH